MKLRPLASWLVILAGTAGLGVGVTTFAPAQEQEDPLQRQIRESQERLDAIRGERQQLRQQLESLSGQVHNVSEEIRNIERQLSTSSSVVAELGVQINALLEQISITTRDMLSTHDQLTARQVILQRRLREIYKRGPLAPMQAREFVRRSAESLQVPPPGRAVRPPVGAGDRTAGDGAGGSA